MSDKNCHGRLPLGRSEGSRMTMQKTLAKLSRVAIAVALSFAICGVFAGPARAGHHHEHDGDEHHGERNHWHRGPVYVAPAPNNYYVPPPNYYYAPEPTYYSYAPEP